MVLRLVLWPVRQFTSFLFPGGDLDGLSPAVTAKAAQAFVNHLRTVSSSPGLVVEEAWSTQGFIAAKEEAVNTGSLMLLYLYSPLHRTAESHCRKVLCHESLHAFLKQPNVLALGLSVHSGQGAQLAQMLQIQAYPALCLLQPPPREATSSTRSMTLLFMAQGNALLAFTADQLIPHMQGSVTRHQVVLAEQEARRLEREQETLLRQQQDAEYQAALLEDQERERQQAEAAAEEERKRREEEEHIAAQEREAKAVIDKARNHIRDPPSSGGAMIRFVMPSGQKINRRFYGDDSIRVCKAFVRLHCHEKEIEMGTIGLSTSYPRKTYNDDEDLTLEDAGLTPQAVLMVQDLDA